MSIEHVSDDDLFVVDTSTVWSKLKPAQKFARMWSEHGYSQPPTLEYPFSFDRKYRLDFAWPSLQVGVEIQGFGFGHQAQQNLARDCEKMRLAIRLGWTVLPFTTRCIASKDRCRDAIEQVCLVLSERAKL